jgi:chromosomal replication initiator protein
MECSSEKTVLRTFTDFGMEFLVYAKPRIMLADIIQVCIAQTDLTKADIISPSRKRRIARPRQKIMWLAKHLTSMSLSEIGRHLGGRDHTTVIHGVKQIDHFIGEEDPEVEELLRLLTVFDNVLPVVDSMPRKVSSATTAHQPHAGHALHVLH